MDYNKMKVAELRSELSKRGLETSGLKADLVQRLEDDDNEGGGSTNSTKSTKTQEEPPSAPKRTRSQAIADLKDDAKNKKSKPTSRKKDSYCTLDGQVFEDYDCMLNQTNIGQNNNKFYVIQIIQDGSNFYTYNRWGL